MALDERQQRLWFFAIIDDHGQNDKAELPIDFISNHSGPAVASLRRLPLARAVRQNARIDCGMASLAWYKVFTGREAS